MVREPVDRWERVGDRLIADCRIFSVRGRRMVRVSADPDRAGEEFEFYVLDSPDFVNVVALTGRGRVVLIRQHRHGVERLSVEVPAGLVDPGESAARAARRELLEETGYEASTWHEVADLDANPAIMSNRAYSFLATGARRVREPEFDPHEDIRCWEVPLAQALAMVGDGRIRHPYAVIALGAAARHPDAAAFLP